MHVLPRRWIAKRNFVWIGRNRRLAKDFGRPIDNAGADTYAAMVEPMRRHLAGA